MEDKKKYDTASLLMSEEEADAKWDELFNTPESDAFLKRLSEEAVAEYEAGETQDLEEWLNEED